MWVNPYVEALVNRNLENNVFSIGTLSHVNDCYMENFRLNFQQGEEQLDVTSNLHWRFASKNFEANFLTDFNVKKILEGTTQKKFSFGYHQNDFHLSLASN